METINKKLAITIELQREMEELARIAWKELAEKLSVRYISSRSPAPHITLELNFRGKHEAVTKILEDVAIQFSSFSIEGFGLGAFVAETPIVHIRWRLNKDFFNLKKALSNELENANKLQIIKKYQPDENWQAKTTLAFMDTSYENLSQILNIVRPLDFKQELIVNGIALYEYSIEEGERKLAFCGFNT